MFRMTVAVVLLEPGLPSFTFSLSSYAEFGLEFMSQGG